MAPKDPRDPRDPKDPRLIKIINKIKILVGGPTARPYRAG